MPNNAQAKKRVVQNEKRRVHNKVIKTSMRTSMKKVLFAPDAETATKEVPQAMKRIDKAAKSNVIHSNTAARYKARLARSIAARD